MGIESPIVHPAPLSHGSLILKNALTSNKNQMDCIPPASESIVINSESSKDDSVSSCDDAPGLRIEENGVGEEDCSNKKPTITLAKAVTLKNFEAMSTSLTIDTSNIAEKSNDRENSEEGSIVIDGASEPQNCADDPLGNSIVLSESEGEGEAANDNSSTATLTGSDAISTGSPAPGRIQIRVPSADTPVINTAASTDKPSAPISSDDIDIVSADNSATGTKQLKVVIPSNKRSDGAVAPVKISPEVKECLQCCKPASCSMLLEFSGVKCFICSEKCLVENRFAQKASLQRAFTKPTDPHRPVVVRKCGQCKETIVPNDGTLSWEAMDFCNEDCLKLYQNKLGMNCSYCQLPCQEQSLGKYCVRFGFDIRQFCHSSCLELYKKGLKTCSYCQEDIPENQGFMAAINDRQQFKEFCSEECMNNYDKMSRNMPISLIASTCDVCKKFKLVTVEVIKAAKGYTLCSDVCFNAFKFVNPNPMGFCDMCRKHFDTENLEELFYTFADEAAITFCSKTCMNAYVLFKRKIVQCNWCKVKKYNFDMIKKIFSNRQVMMLCSFHCYSMWKMSPKRNTCDHCKLFGQIQYHLGMSDGTLRSFCGHECLMKFQLQFKKVPVTPSLARPLDSSATIAYPVIASTTPTQKLGQVSVKTPVVPKKTPDNSVSGLVVASPSTPNSIATICAPPSRINDNTATIPVISSVTSLEPIVDATSLPEVPHVTVNTPKVTPTRKPVGVLINKPGMGSGQMIVKQQLLLVPPSPVQMCNKSTYFNCYPATKSKGVFCKPMSSPVSTQTSFKSIKNVLENIDEGDEDNIEKKSSFENEDSKHEKNKLVVIKRVIKEVPVIVPIPIPIFIPVPVPLYNIPVPTPLPIPVPVPLCLPTPHESLEKILNDIQELCSMLPEIVAERRKRSEGNGTYSCQVTDINISLESRTRKRGHSVDAEVSDASDNGDNSNKRRKVDDGSCKDSDRTGGGEGNNGSQQEGNNGSQQGGSPPLGAGGSGDDDNDPSSFNSSSVLSKPSSIKPFQNIFGVNAWKKWVLAKNEELSKSGGKQFNTELLFLSAEDLSESLSLFVTEFRKPSGQRFPADILYYLVLGIQVYLQDNGRNDNVFYDPEFVKFADTFDEIITKETFDSPEQLVPKELLVPRIEESHLWDSKQLGPHSPFSLLFTVLFFITKGFNIVDVEDHMNLAFSQMLTPWPRSQNSSEKQTSKYLSLRYFPPNQSKGESLKDALSPESSKKKFEIAGNSDDTSYPVNLCRYYFSKCPESVRNRSDVFYLQPEKSYLPESPVWYTTEPIDKATLTKMFNRLRLVKEISLVLHPEALVE